MARCSTHRPRPDRVAGHRDAGRKTTVEAVDLIRCASRVRKLVEPGPAPRRRRCVADVLVHRGAGARYAEPRPAVSFARDRNGRYSVQDLIDRVLAAPRDRARAFLSTTSKSTVIVERHQAPRRREMWPMAFRLSLHSSTNPRFGSVRRTSKARSTGSHFAFGGTTTPFAEWTRRGNPTSTLTPCR